MTWIDYLLIPVVKITIVIGAVLGLVPLMVLAERKIIAWIQNRPGPNRVGPWGILQTVADGVKLLFKEDITPSASDKLLYLAAPLLTLAPAILLLALIPIGPDIVIAGRTIHLGVAQLNIGILYYYAISSLAVYGIIMAGWASNSKYSMLGGLRASAQMISYELPLALSAIGVFLLAHSVSVDRILDDQAMGVWTWNIFKQPAAFLIFLIAGFAETNRLPFDLPEGESELGAGYHTEYSSMKFAMFFLAEYANMLVFGSLISILFLGGFHGPFPGLIPIENQYLAAACGVFWLAAKVGFFIFFFIYIRATWPRFRYDQLMDFGWKILLPLSLGNVVATAIVIAITPQAGASRTIILFIIGLGAIIGVDRYLTVARRRLLDAPA